MTGASLSSHIVHCFLPIREYFTHIGMSPQPDEVLRYNTLRKITNFEKKNRSALNLGLSQRSLKKNIGHTKAVEKQILHG